MPGSCVICPANLTAAVTRYNTCFVRRTRGQSLRWSHISALMCLSVPGFVSCRALADGHKDLHHSGVPLPI